MVALHGNVWRGASLCIVHVVNGFLGGLLVV